MNFVTDNIWAILVGINYALAIALIIVILFKQLTPSKTLSYIIVLMVLPFLGLLVYVLFGQDYRKSKIFDRKNILNQSIVKSLLNDLTLTKHHFQTIESILGEKSKIISLLYSGGDSKLTIHNELEVLRNGEKKFEALIEDLRGAKHHIHFEYYIFTDDVIGNNIIDLLCKKAEEGVEVRLIFDDVGSNISRKSKSKLKTSGVQFHAFMPVLFPRFTGKMNYRDHRKIAVIDGEIGYLGGINISDDYININEEVYWRDTHLKIRGDAVKHLQILFFTSWNFVSGSSVELSKVYFPETNLEGIHGVQIIGSGPDTDWPFIKEAVFSAITTASDYLYLTTPYFIPNDEIVVAMQTAARSGVDVRLLLPKKSDSWISGSASNSYLNELLEAGVKVYLYEKGFIHAKTFVMDDEVCSIGTANMDFRSYEINFEVTAFVYDKPTCMQLKEQFEEDLKSASVMNLEKWESRSIFYKFLESIARLLAPLL